VKSFRINFEFEYFRLNIHILFLLVCFAATMLMPTKNRQMIYEYLFKEGVLVAKKDFQASKHPEIEVPNLQVIKTLQVDV